MVSEYNKRLAARRRQKLERGLVRKPVGIMPTLFCFKVTPEKPEEEILLALTGSISNIVIRPLGEGPLELEFSVRNDFVSNNFTYRDERDKDKPPHIVPPFVVEAGELVKIKLVEGTGAYVSAAFFADSTLLTIYVNVNEVMGDAKPETTSAIPTGS